jgi:hypothetical protein
MADPNPAVPAPVRLLRYTGRARGSPSTWSPLRLMTQKPPFVEASSCKHQELFGSRGLLDHLVGKREQVRRNGKAERLGGLEVDDEL